MMSGQPKKKRGNHKLKKWIAEAKEAPRKAVAYSFDEAAKALRISTALLKELVDSGEIRCRRARTRILFSKQHLVDFLNSDDSPCMNGVAEKKVARQSQPFTTSLIHPKLAKKRPKDYSRV